MKADSSEGMQLHPYRSVDELMVLMARQALWKCKRDKVCLWSGIYDGKALLLSHKSVTGIFHQIVLSYIT